MKNQDLTERRQKAKDSVPLHERLSTLCKEWTSFLALLLQNKLRHQWTLQRVLCLCVRMPALQVMKEAGHSPNTGGIVLEGIGKHFYIKRRGQQFFFLLCLLNISVCFSNSRHAQEKRPCNISATQNVCLHANIIVIRLEQVQTQADFMC